jgi:hypothetical protein
VEVKAKGKRGKYKGKTVKRMVERPREEWKIAYIEDPIFTKQEWKKLNAILDANKTKGRPAQLEGKYLCRGLLKCDICGSTYTTFNGGSGPKHKKYYYACPNRRIPKKKLINGAVPCKVSPLVRQELLDQTVWNEVVKVLLWPDKVVEEWFRKSEPNMIYEDQRELDEIEEQIEEHRKQIRRLIDLGEAGEQEIGYLKGRIQHNEALINTLQEKADKVKERRVQAEAAKAKEDYIRSGVDRLLKTLESKIDTANLAKHKRKKTHAKREVIGRVLSGFDFDAKRALLDAVVADEKIRVCSSAEEVKVRPSWSERPVKANFEVWFRGMLNVDRVVNVLQSIDKSGYLKALDAPWDR